MDANKQKGRRRTCHRLGRGHTRGVIGRPRWLVLVAALGTMLVLTAGGAPEVADARPVSHVGPTITVNVPIRADMWHVQSAVDRCRGPVATRYPLGQLISQHDFCSDRWVLRLRVREIVRFTGKIRGVYQVRKIVYRRRGTGTFADLHRWVGGQVQAGMCAGPRYAEWVGLSRLSQGGSAGRTS
jgi:hypothetical protein